MGFFLNKSHDGFRDFHGAIGIVGHLQLKQQVGEPHDPQSDFSVALDHVVDFRQRIDGHVDGIVKKTDA